MKIGIIGLNPRQVADISRRKLPKEVVFFDNSKAYVSANIVAFANKVDRLLVIQQQVPHRQLEGVPRSKRHPMAGGVSTILRYLEALRASGHLSTAANDPEPAQVKPDTAPTEVTTQQTDVDQVATDTPTTTTLAEDSPTMSDPVIPLASDVPKGYKSQYTIPTGVIHTNHPKAGGAHDYKILHVAPVGEVIRYARPANVSFKQWRTRITSMRFAYATKHNILIEAHFYKDYVDLQVMRVSSPSATQAPAQTASSTTTQSESTVAERAFWRRVYLTSLTHINDTALADAQANTALQQYRERFYNHSR